MSEHQEIEILIYQVEGSTSATEVMLQGETVWLLQEQMAELFMWLWRSRDVTENSPFSLTSLSASLLSSVQMER